MFCHPERSEGSFIERDSLWKYEESHIGLATPNVAKDFISDINEEKR